MEKIRKTMDEAAGKVSATISSNQRKQFELLFEMIDSEKEEFLFIRSEMYFGHSTRIKRMKYLSCNSI
jgi:hypothetical protein